MLILETVPAPLFATQITKFETDAAPLSVSEPSGFWTMDRPPSGSKASSQPTPTQTSVQSALQSPHADWTPSSTAPSQLSSS